MSFYRHSAILYVPAAHKDAINRVLNLVFGDSGDNISIGCSATGSAPATHYIGSIWLDAGKLTLLQEDLVSHIQNDILVPEGGWPIEGVSKANAIAAANAFRIRVESNLSDTFDAQMPGRNFAAEQAARNLIVI